jgi:hypothetical protein
LSIEGRQYRIIAYPTFLFFLQLFNPMLQYSLPARFRIGRFDRLK